MSGYPMAAYYGIDITEIDGYDNLHNARGILKDTMERAALLFGAKTYMLVNGSTGGILSAVSTVASGGGKILAARNCHRSFYHAVYLNRCRAEYIYPCFMEKYGLCGSIPVSEIEKKLETDSEIRAVFLTSPTYDGIVSDIGAIVNIAHARRIPVIVDEAHGAHFVLDGRFPKSAVHLGADMVIHSIHKTLPAMTQTALLHVQGDLVDREKLERFLRIYQTSSPSYILMAAIEQCISILEKEGKALCNRFFERNALFEERTKGLRDLQIFPEGEENSQKEVFDIDAGKKIISGRKIRLTGPTLYKLFLDKYQLQMEMAGAEYVTAIMTIMDKEEGFKRLEEALLDIDMEKSDSKYGDKYYDYRREEQWKETDSAREGRKRRKISVGFAEELRPGKTACEIYRALEGEKEICSLENCVGEISAEFVAIYPPGIPLIVPGEYFTDDIVEQLYRYQEQGFEIEGMQDQNKKVCIVRKETYA